MLEFWPCYKVTLFSVKEWWNSFQHDNSSFSEPLLESSSQAVTLDFDEDRDVKMERNRVLSGSIENAIIYLRNLRKVFVFVWIVPLLFKIKFYYTNASAIYYLLSSLANFRCIQEERIKVKKWQ